MSDADNKPDAKAVKAQIKGLRQIKPSVRRMSGFGDNHHDAIDAQIEVLEKNLSDLQIDDLSAFEDEDDYHENDKWRTNVRDAAYGARKWLDGDRLEGYNDLIESWKELAQ